MFTSSVLETDRRGCVFGSAYAELLLAASIELACLKLTPVLAFKKRLHNEGKSNEYHRFFLHQFTYTYPLLSSS